MIGLGTTTACQALLQLGHAIPEQAHARHNYSMSGMLLTGGMTCSWSDAVQHAVLYNS